MNLIETNFSRTAESQWLWQGAIWTFQFDKLWRHSQKQLQKYNIRDKEYPRVLAAQALGQPVPAPTI